MSGGDILKGTVAPVFADYVDGASARLHRARLEVGPEILRINLPDGAEAVDWPLSRIRAIPDQADRALAVFGLAGDHPARLLVAERKTARQLAALCPDLLRRDKTPNLMRRLLILAGGAIGSVLLIVFVLVPVLADQLAEFLPPAGEQALGDTTFRQIRQALGSDTGLIPAICHRPAGTKALARMTARLTGNSRLAYKIRLHVLDHPMVNAFALPGGHIVLFRGLLDDAHNPEEVAAVLGHEMGHVQHRDPTRLALRSAGSVGVLGLLLGDFAGGAAVLYLSEQLINAKYSRKAEAAADKYSQNLLAESGLPTGPMADFFLRLLKDTGQDSGLLSHLARHPDLRGRADAARAANRVGGDFTPVLSATEWRNLQAICD